LMKFFILTKERYNINIKYKVEKRN